MGSEKRAFDFIQIGNLPPKPRHQGVVEIRGSYYSPVTYTYLKELLELVGPYVDGFKFVAGCQRLYPEKEVRRIIKLCHKHGVYVSTGGFIERVIVQGPDAVDAFLIESRRLGFNVVEVSSGLADIPIEDKVAIIHKVRQLGMAAKPEISFMEGAGAGTKVSKYKIKLRKPEEVIREAQACLEAGAYKLMFESEGITEDLPRNRWKTKYIEQMIDKFGLDAWMFEAADPAVFKWYLQNYGPAVNLFIDHSQVFEYQAWRSKLWGNPSIWEGKEFKYIRGAPVPVNLPQNPQKPPKSVHEHRRPVRKNKIVKGQKHLPEL